MRGSCEWLTKKRGFREWQNPKNADAPLYWISAKPATGKSVLSGFIVKYLRDMNQDCSFFFFNYSNNSQSTIGYFLRSIAWQMAMKHQNILQTIIDISYKDDQLSKADFRSLWRKVFLDGILGVKLDRPQYWVIDALDECRGEVELIPLLLKVSELCRIRIVVTCRNNYESYSLISNSRTKVLSEEILQGDTSRDISLYMKAHVDLLPFADKETQQIMVATILTKSAGCFLWVDLVLKELKQIHSSAEVSRVLEDVPSDMDELYSRILDSMSNARYSKHLAKAILTWIVCSARLLTTDELYYAIQLDIKDTIDNIEKSIAACCGQLVYVDSLHRVHMVHQTARDFLLRPTITSEFAIEKKTGHQRLGMTCIEYLAGEEMRAPRQWKLGVSSVLKVRSPFANYACTSLSEHISHVSSEDSVFLTALTGLLCSSNILAWIEFLAQNSNLRCVIQTGKSLRRYLQKRAHFVSPIGAEVEILDSWATDLIRLVIKFGPNLAASPGSIFSLIPPFCPSKSAPRKLFAASTRGISVLGLSATDWDDCLSTITHYQTSLTALACSEKHFALGLNTGKVVVYHEMTCQEAQVLQHGEHVRILQFGKTGNIIASGGMKNIRLWDVNTWQQIWRLGISQECMSLQFTDEDKMLLGASRSNCLMIWDLTTGELTNDPNWTHNLQGTSHYAFRRPIYASICVESGLLAVVYRGRDIILWDIEEEQLNGTCGKETGGQNYVNGGLVFGQGMSVGLLAASYSDGDLVVFDVDKGTIKETTLANASSLASSPDGLTLASVDALGTIQLFDFESLKLLYRISSDGCGVRALAFSKNNHRLLDIRGSECRVWDPAILIREDINEEISGTISMSTAPVELSLESSEDIILITSVACHEGGEVFFCGREDGSIYIHETTDGSSNQKLLGHACGVSIVSLYFDNGSEMLISVDSSSRVMMHKLSCKNGVWRASKPSFDLRVGVAVEQVLSNGECGRILICSSQKASLYSVTEDESTVLETLSWENYQHGRWGTQYDRKLDETQLVQILGNTAHLYDWQTLRKLTDTNGILLKDITPELSIQSITLCANTSVIATTFGESLKPNSRPHVVFWNAADLSINVSSAFADPIYQHLRDQIQLLIGSHRRRLIFLHHSGWICSANLDGSRADKPVRHFFVPNDWLSAGVQLMIEVTCNGDIIFVKRHEAAVIKRGLEISDQWVSVAERKKPSIGKRPSFARRRSQGSLEIPSRSLVKDTRPSLVGSGISTPGERLEQNPVYSGRNSPAMISPKSPRGRLQTPKLDKTFLDLSPTRNQLSGL
jgi:WD40 repeat protein